MHRREGILESWSKIGPSTSTPGQPRGMNHSRSNDVNDTPIIASGRTRCSLKSWIASSRSVFPWPTWRNLRSSRKMRRAASNSWAAKRSRSCGSGLRSTVSSTLLASQCSPGFSKHHIINSSAEAVSEYVSDARTNIDPSNAGIHFRSLFRSKAVGYGRVGTHT